MKIFEEEAVREHSYLKKLQNFLWLANHSRKFIKNVTGLNIPLYDLLENEYVWAEKQDNAFSCLKAALLEPKVQYQLDFFKPFIPETDTCKLGVGGLNTKKIEMKPLYLMLLGC